MPLPELPELEELYRLYRADLYRYLCHLTHDSAEAEDLLSETFLRALKRLHTYHGDCAVKTWYRHYYSKKMTVPAAWCSCGPWATATMKLPRSCTSAKARPA